MRRCAFHRSRAHQTTGLPLRSDFALRGFTLLEMCVVLLIMGLLLGMTLPAMRTAFVEQELRNDSRQLALMVRTAMLQSDEQSRPYVIDFTSKTLALHPQAPTAHDDDSTTSKAAAARPPAVEADFALDASTKVLVPNPDKAGEWIALPATTWLFQPGDLCHVPRVRLLRGEAWLEMSFNALTGHVEDESTYIP